MAQLQLGWVRPETNHVKTAKRSVNSLLITEDLLISEHEAGVGGSQGVETSLLPQDLTEVGVHLLLLPPFLHQLRLVLDQLLAQTGASLDVVRLVEADMTVVEFVKMPGCGVENLEYVSISTLSQGPVLCSHHG